MVQNFVWHPSQFSLIQFSSLLVFSFQRNSDLTKSDEKWHKSVKRKVILCDSHAKPLYSSHRLRHPTVIYHGSPCHYIFSLLPKPSIHHQGVKENTHWTRHKTFEQIYFAPFKSDNCGNSIEMNPNLLWTSKFCCDWDFMTVLPVRKRWHPAWLSIKAMADVPWDAVHLTDSRCWCLHGDFNNYHKTRY